METTPAKLSGVPALQGFTYNSFTPPAVHKSVPLHVQTLPALCRSHGVVIVSKDGWFPLPKISRRDFFSEVLEPKPYTLKVRRPTIFG